MEWKKVNTSAESRTVATRRRAAPQCNLNGITILSVLSCVIVLGCDADMLDEGDVLGDRSPPQEPGRDVTPSPELAETPGDVDLNERLPGQASDGSGSPADTATAQNTPDESSDVAIAPGAGSMQARATLEPTQGNEARGTVEFTPSADGIEIRADLTGLEQGTHGIHLHEVGNCTAADASSAGDHFAPDGNPHGAPRDEAHHAGDLGNITADGSGNASKQMTDDELRIDDGQHGVVGRAVIVHMNEDDLQSQPSGESGDPVACGVIELVEAPQGATDRV